MWLKASIGWKKEERGAAEATVERVERVRRDAVEKRMLSEGKVVSGEGLWLTVISARLDCARSRPFVAQALLMKLLKAVL